jgi:hypothetical protein
VLCPTVKRKFEDVLKKIPKIKEKIPAEELLQEK